LIEKARQVSPNADDFTIHFDVSLFEATASTKYELIDHLELNAAIDSVRFSLLHLNRMLEIQATSELSVSRGSTTHAEVRKKLRSAISEPLSGIAHTIAQSLRLISNDLNDGREGRT
jgi:hypothetical protein